MHLPQRSEIYAQRFQSFLSFLSCLKLPAKQQPAMCLEAYVQARNASQLGSFTAFQAVVLNPGEDKRQEDEKVRDLLPCPPL